MLDADAAAQEQTLTPDCRRCRATAATACSLLLLKRNRVAGLMLEQSAAQLPPILRITHLLQLRLKRCAASLLLLPQAARR